MDRPYKALFTSRIAAAIGAAKAAAAIAHKGVKGRVREILVGDLFRPLLPADLGVGTGQIVTHDGQNSSEQDVVIYDRRILPPALFEGGLGIFPVECVLATVEVKTTLTAQELRLAHESATAIRRFTYLPGERDRLPGAIVSHDVLNAIATVFALDTDLGADSKSELQRYHELHSSGDPPIKAICVSGRGYWYFANGQWRHIEADSQHREACGFIVGLFDSFSTVRKSRRQPNLWEYFQ